MKPLTPSDRRELKARAHALKPVVMIGNDGLSPAVLGEIERALKSHELIKIRVAGDDRDARVACLAEICARTGAQTVQHIGKILVIFRLDPAPEPSRVTPRRPATESTRAERAIARTEEAPRARPRGRPAASPSSRHRTRRDGR